MLMRPADFYVTPRSAELADLGLLHLSMGNDDGAIARQSTLNDDLLIGLMTYDAGFHTHPSLPIH